MASTLFTGSSRYTADFQAVIERSVGIASLALTQMQQQRAGSNDELTALKALDVRVAALQTTIATIGSSVGKNAWQASSSDSSSVSVSIGEGVASGNYTMKVVSLGAFSTAVGKSQDRTVADPNAGSFLANGIDKLTLRITDHNTQTPASEDTVIDLSAGTTLQNVVDAVNSQAGSKVRAAIVNIGTTDDPQYTISLQSTKLGKLALQLKEGNPPGGAAGDILNIDETSASDPSLGSKAEYRLNGATILSDSRTVTLAPKVTANLIKADASKEISISISRGTESFSGAIQNFVNVYNALASQLDSASDKNSPLRGNSIVGNIRNQLRRVITAEFPGGLENLAKIGVEFTREGSLRFNSTLFATETSGKFDELSALIGTATSGGFFQSITEAMNGIKGSTGSGFLDATIESLTTSLAAEDQRIVAETSRVEQFTADLQDRLAKADAAIAMLEQQAEYFTNMFEAMRTNQRSMS